MKILITGGAGFIGTALCLHYLQNTEAEIINLDALTYAANHTALKEMAAFSRYTFIQGDIR
ncbi:MAG: NAD-dependent epimerase/dehydratase family protein, partial [Candidatus Adiutrix sp.]